MTNKLATCALLLLASLPLAAQSSHPGFRDQHRHPVETLQFFGLKPCQTMIEITPGNAWYSEILAPLLHDDGHNVAAIYSLDTSDSMRKATGLLVEKYFGDPALYGNVSIVEFQGAAPVFGPAGSADLILTFRNVQKLLVAGNAAAMFKGCHDVLKPGGVPDIVDHRARAADGNDNRGYVTLKEMTQLAEAVGFNLDAQSEINANPRDTKDYPEGVRTLPSTLKLGQWTKIGISPSASRTE